MSNDDIAYYADPVTRRAYCSDHAPEGAIGLPDDEVLLSTLPMQMGDYHLTCWTCGVEVWNANEVAEREVSE